MTTLTKIAFSALAAGVIASSAQAGLINGSVSFSGSITAYTSTTGTGTTASSFQNARSIAFSGNEVVAANPSGTFAGTAGAGNTLVTLFSPMVINPVAVPSGTVLWNYTFSGKTYLFTLNAPLTEDPLTSPYNVLILRGTGVMSDNVAGDIANTGTFVATFTSAASGNTATFAFNSSSSANPAATPEAGTSVLLLGLGLAALGTYAQLRKQAA